MVMKTAGIHHVSSIVGHAQKNIDMFSGVLGMRLVKKTVNFDDKDTYHLYYGNREASTGLTTTFPWINGREGKIGDGQVGAVRYAVRPGTFPFWEKRLAAFGIETFRYRRFGLERLAFTTIDELEIEFMERTDGPVNTWSFNGVESDDAIVGIDSAILFSRKPMETAALLTDLFGYQEIDHDAEVRYFKINDALGGTLELHQHAHGGGRTGVGVVHHIALKVENDSLPAWREQLLAYGMKPTEIKNRKYFQSLYFREPGGILIELATKGPGLLVDEPLETLGEELMIPPHFVDQAAEIKAELMPIEVREVTELSGYGYRDAFEYEVVQRREALKKAMGNFQRLAKERSLTAAEQKEWHELRQAFVKISQPKEEDEK